jgi:hypothetical protein
MTSWVSKTCWTCLHQKRPPAAQNNFVAMAANNLIKNAHWPADAMEMHYGIAREGLRVRLKISPFL